MYIPELDCTYKKQVQWPPPFTYRSVNFVKAFINKSNKELYIDDYTSCREVYIRWVLNYLINNYEKENKYIPIVVYYNSTLLQKHYLQNKIQNHIQTMEGSFGEHGPTQVRVITNYYIEKGTALLFLIGKHWFIQPAALSLLLSIIRTLCQNNNKVSFKGDTLKELCNSLPQKVANLRLEDALCMQLLQKYMGDPLEYINKHSDEDIINNFRKAPFKYGFEAFTKETGF